jgi:hypothetical protein
MEASVARVLSCLAEIPDPRCRHARQHRLSHATWVTSLWAIADSDARCAEQRRRHPFWLSCGTCGEVGQVVHAELRGGLSEALSAGGEESAEEAT